MGAQPHNRATAVDTRQPPREISADARRVTERRLFQRYCRFGDSIARERLIDRFLPLADRLAGRYRRCGEPFEDLVQVARLGLVKAVDRFDPDRGVSFTSFAVPTILGDLRRHFRDFGWSLHLPRGLKERVLDVDAVAAELAGRLRRSPSPAEIAEAAGLSTEDVLEAIEASAVADPLSLDAPLGAGEEAPHSYADTLGATDDRLELVELAATVEPSFRDLAGRDRLLLYLRFIEGLTQSEIASQFGVSQMQVSRRLRRTLDRLGALTDGDLEPARARSESR